MSTQKLLKKFEKIYEKTYNNTLKYIVCKCGSLEDVDDIIQETYVELYKILKQGKQMECEQAYIITIAKNKIIKYYKENKKIQTISLFQEKDDEEFIIDIDSRYKHRVRIY